MDNPTATKTRRSSLSNPKVVGRLRPYERMFCGSTRPGKPAAGFLL